MAQDPYHSLFQARIERSQLALSRSLLVMLFLAYQIPFLKPYASKFLKLQYLIGTGSSTEPAQYDMGWEDSYYVAAWVLYLTFARSLVMAFCKRLANSRWIGISSTKGKMRFAEQSWSFFYYSILFLFGVFLYLRAPYYNNLDNLYVGWPHYQMDSLFKKYYLVLIAAWLQQIIVLNIEQRRKDHYQMFSHHIITCCLIIGSYYFYFVRIGHLILMLMDLVDIVLAAAKMLKYAQFTRSCDLMFIVFLISWIILRHGVYNILFYHAWHNSRHLMAAGECVAGVVQKRCWNTSIINTFLALLGGLQVITIIWMFLILKVAYKVVTGKGAEDVRSDDLDLEYEEQVKMEAKERVEKEEDEKN